jgi:hypothetical protein
MTLKLVYSRHAKQRGQERNIKLPAHIIIDPSNVSDIDGWKQLVRYQAKVEMVIVPANEPGYFLVKTVWRA